MTSTDKRTYPSSYLKYEQFIANVKDENLNRWLERFLFKYELACHYNHIDVEGRTRNYSQYSSLFGVVLAYQALDDICDFCHQQGLTKTNAAQYISSNDLLHEELVSNTRLCEYLRKSAIKAEDTFKLLDDSLNSKTSNVVIFGYYITNLFLKQDFNSKNLGISNAIHKNTLNEMRIYLNAISDRLFTKFANSLTPKNLSAE